MWFSTDMNLKIILDEQHLKEYIKWLPDLKDEECYYGSLFCRKKYDTTGTIKSDKSQLKSFVATNKDYLLRKIKQLETFYSYDGKRVPQESLALYLNVNPRCLVKANFKTMKDILTNIERMDFKNPETIAKSAIQVSASKKRYFIFDLDGKEISLSQILEKLYLEIFGGTPCFSILETRGGFHIMVDLEKISQNVTKSWYNNMKKEFPNIDQSGDIMSPVPGCVQGGFEPKLY